MANISVTAGSVLAVGTATRKTGVAGETITAGQALYYSPGDTKYYKAITTTATTANVAGIALTGASVDQPVIMLTAGDINIGGTCAVGEVYVASDTAGAIAAAGDNGSADYVTVIGIAKTTAIISVKILVSGVAHA